jgi:tetratricopeptide (TPR) repeat protein
MVTEGETMGTSREQIQDFWALYREATAQRTSRQTQAAAETYSRALALNPDHEDVLYYFGSMRFALGDFAAAESAWRRLIARNPSSARTHSQLGSLYLCLDANAPFRLDSAEAHLHLAHEINGEETGPLLHLGEAALIRGNLATATRYFNEVLGSHAKSAEAHFYAGYIAWKSGDMAAARAAFRLAASAPPPATAGVPGEGDTRSGSSPMRAEQLRCNQFAALTAGLANADIRRELTVRYRKLDGLLINARRGRLKQ